MRWSTAAPKATNSVGNTTRNPSRFSSPARTPLPAAQASTTPPPRQSLVYGPLTTTSVTTIVREESCKAKRKEEGDRDGARTDAAPASRTEREEGQRRRADSRGSHRSGASSSSSLPSPQRHATPTSDDLRALRQTRSLFLCGRGLLSLRHIQHLPEMLSLRFLSVHMNAIRTLEAGCLKTLRHLVELDLSANEVQELPVGCWTGLERLERLNLSSNLLTRLSPAAFRGLSALQWLSLGFNSLEDISGLGSVPAAAPLAYVDLCANRIATVEEVLQALTPHRAHLQELRLASPAPPDTTVGTSTDSTLNGSYWQVPENPLCSDVVEADSAPGAPEAGPSFTLPAPPSYVRHLLTFFPRLSVVNGVTYGVDPLEMLASSHPHNGDGSDVDENRRAERVAEETEGGGAVRSTSVHSPNKISDDNEDFARLLSQPLPRLPRSLTPSLSSSSSTTPSAQCSPHPTTSRHTSRSRRGRHSRSQSHERPRITLIAEQRRAEAKEASQLALVSQRRSDSGTTHNHLHGAHRRPHAIPSEGETQRRAGRRQSAPGPRRATLRRRSSSASTSPALSHVSSATASPSVVAPSQNASSFLHQQRQEQQHSSSASSHARQLHFDGDDPSHMQEEENDAEGTRVRQTRGTGQLSSVDGEGPSKASHQREIAEVTNKTARSSCRPQLSSEPRAACTRQMTATSTMTPSVPRCSPPGMTDTSDLSPSPDVRSVQRQTRAMLDDEGAFSVDMSSSDSAETSSVSLAIGNAQAPQGKKQATPVRNNSHIEGRDAVHTLTAPLGHSAKPSSSSSPQSTAAAAGAAARHTTSQVARRQPHVSASSTPFSTQPTHSSAGLPWRPKQISRGTSVEAGELQLNEDAAATVAAAVEKVRQETAALVEQLEEQAALRTTTIANLRRHLELTRSQYVDSQREAQQQKQQLQSQVAALKDELARRSEEAAIVQRKQQAQLNRAVDSVKAEWSRRLEAHEQHSAVLQEEAAAAHTRQVAELSESNAQLQQTAAVKTSQLTALERQVCVMEGEMDALRRRALAERQHTQAQIRLLLTEAEERRAVEAAASTTRFTCCGLFVACQSQLQRKAMQDASLELQETLDALDSEVRRSVAQASEYEAALQHATNEALQLRRQLEQPESDVQPAEGAAVVNSTSRLSSSPPASPRQPSTSEQVSSTWLETAAEKKSRTERQHNGDGAQDFALVSTPASTPIAPPPLPLCNPPCTSLVVAIVDDADVPLAAQSSMERSDVLAVTLYWRDAHARTEAQLRRVEAALQVATTTQQSLTSENTRLLRRVELLESEEAKAKAAYATLAQVAAQEKENLLRTLHTLRADMEKKDDALDALEEEARAKLNEKRRRIAELEDAVETLTAQHTRATEMNVSHRTELEAAQRSLAQLQSDLDKERSRVKSEVERQTAQLPEMERKQRDLSEMLATRVAQAHQHELEKKTLVHALTTAREQLLRLQDSNTLLSSANASAREQLTRQQGELDAARQQLRETQEATRAKQRATREALSQLMTADGF